MKWTPEQTKELTDMCMAGVPNIGLAKHFNVPLTEIHAKRSALGITIPKVRTMLREGPAAAKPAKSTVNRDFDATFPPRKVPDVPYNPSKTVSDALDRICDEHGLPRERVVGWIKAILAAMAREMEAQT